MTKIIGYIVMEHCQDYEQALAIDHDPRYPPEGLLDWSDKAKTLFPSRRSARAAINRTHHFEKAFGDCRLPKRALCKIVAVVAAPA